MSMATPTPPEIGSYAGAAVTVATSLTLTQFGVIVGIVTALLTFALNAWYTHQRNAREDQLAELDRREREVRLAQFLAQLQAPEVKQQSHHQLERTAP
jgi:H+/gluconate symporter-like permease